MTLRILAGKTHADRRGKETPVPFHESVDIGIYTSDESTLHEQKHSLRQGAQDLTVTVDGHFMYSQRSDGLIVSTPTGSTAYALSSGGPLLHPKLAGIAFVPIAPHTLSNRPIVVSDSSKVVIEIAAVRAASVNFDMQSFANLMVGDQIHIQRSQNVVCFLHPKEWNYFHTLRAKLHWNEAPAKN